MVDLRPFSGIRFDTERAGAELAALIAPPYDVISRADLDRYYARDPHNIVRIDLNRPEPEDGEQSRYTRANDFYRAWLHEGVLRRDPAHRYYVLAQRFTGPDGVERTRTGFFSRARLVHFDEGVILPHERTLRGPKLDRLNLYRATHASLSPIFGAYADPSGEIRETLAATTGGSAPLAEAEHQGTHNTLFGVDDPAAQARLHALFADRKLYIADGHHRYETALAYRDEQRAAHGRGPSDEGSEFVLMFAAAVEDPGMVIFPTHRLIAGLPGWDEPAFLDRLAPFFTETPIDAHDPRAAQAALASCTSTFLLRTGTAARLITLREDAPLDQVQALPPEPALARLDVSILHAVVLEHVLGLSRESQALQVNLRYSKDFREALGAPVQDASVQLALLMNPTRVDEVVAVAESGAVMPQKSTFFYPKVPTGLLIYPFA